MLETLIKSKTNKASIFINAVAVFSTVSVLLDELLSLSKFITIQQNNGGTVFHQVVGFSLFHFLFLFNHNSVVVVVMTCPTVASFIFGSLTHKDPNIHL